MNGIIYSRKPRVDGASTRQAFNGIPCRLAVFVATILVVLGVASAVATSPASAMSPQQTTLTGAVNTLYWDLDAFWRWALNSPSYRSPTIGYYYSSPTYVAACRREPLRLHDHGGCPNYGNAQIWIHYSVNQDKVNRLGDYAAASSSPTSSAITSGTSAG